MNLSHANRPWRRIQNEKELIPSACPPIVKKALFSKRFFLNLMKSPELYLQSIADEHKSNKHQVDVYIVVALRALLFLLLHLIRMIVKVKTLKFDPSISSFPSGHRSGLNASLTIFMLGVFQPGSFPSSRINSVFRNPVHDGSFQRQTFHGVNW